MNAQRRWERREERRRRKATKKLRYRVCLKWRNPWPWGWRERKVVVAGFNTEVAALVYAGEYDNRRHTKVYLWDSETDHTYHVVTEADRDRAHRHRLVFSKLPEQDVRVNWSKEGF